MFFNKTALALLVLGAVVIAGCVGGGGQVSATTGNGLEITNFTTAQAQVYSGSTTLVTFGVENQGETTLSASTGGILLIGADDWIPGNITRKFDKDMRPADPTKTPPIPAGRQTETWRLTGPSLGRGQSRTYTLTGRVYYDYLTSAFGSIAVYPQSEATAAQNRGETLQKSSWSVTRGPIRMDVIVAPDPVVVSAAGDTFTLQVTFTNTENGVIYTNGTVANVTDGTNTAPFAIPEPALNKLTIDVTGFTGDLSIVDPSCYQNVELVGNSASIICDVRVTQVPNVKRTFSVGVNADYGYYADQQMTLTALGK